MSGRTAKKKKRKNRRKTALVLIVLMLMIAVVLFVLSTTVWFNVTEVRVTGSSRYQPDKIIEASKISIGENMVFMDTKIAEDHISMDLPYIGEATVKRNFDGKIVIKVKECKPDSVLVSKDGIFILSGYKCLDKVNTAPDSLMQIKAEPSFYGLGRDVQFGEGVSEALDEVRSAFKEAGLNDISQIDVTNISDITAIYNGSIRLRIGTTESISKKINNAVSIMKTEKEKYGDSVTGTIDLRYLADGSNRSYFTRENISSDISSAENKDENSQIPEK